MAAALTHGALLRGRQARKSKPKPGAHASAESSKERMETRVDDISHSEESALSSRKLHSVKFNSIYTGVTKTRIQPRMAFKSFPFASKCLTGTRAADSITYLYKKQEVTFYLLDLFVFA